MPTIRLAVALVLAAGSSQANAEVLDFPHILEIGGSFVETPLGSGEVPYQAVNLSVPISIEESLTPPTAFEYHYEEAADFPVDFSMGERGGFVLRFEDGGGSSAPDPNDESRWFLTMHYRPVALIGGIEFTLPDGGLLAFVRSHGDPQPLPVESDELRHAEPVVFLIEEPVLLYPGGDARSASFFRIDSASRLVINEADHEVPAPAVLGLVGLTGVCRLNRRKR